MTHVSQLVMDDFAMSAGGRRIHVANDGRTGQRLEVASGRVDPNALHVSQLTATSGRTHGDEEGSGCDVFRAPGYSYGGFVRLVETMHMHPPKIDWLVDRFQPAVLVQPIGALIPVQRSDGCFARLLDGSAFHRRHVVFRRCAPDPP